METNLFTNEVEDDIAISDEDDFIVEEVQNESDDQEIEKFVSNEQSTEEAMLQEPKKGMLFDSATDAGTFYKRYARKKGFGVTRRTSRTNEDGKVNYLTLACSRQSKAQYTSKDTFNPNPSTRMQCPAKVNLSLRGDKLRITSFRLDHNHAISPSKARFLRCHKKLSLHAKRTLELNDQAGIHINKNFGSLVMEAGGYENLEFGEKECRNYLQDTRRLKLGAGDADAIYHYFLHMQSKDPNFFYVMDVDEDSRLRNVFWADARSRATYESFSDVVTFDTTYLTNKYNMPFAPFVGVNHHGQSVLLGCALLSSEDTETFVWLFKSWLACMSNKPPKAIITDQCQAMKNAIEEVFPQARHRWCIWHIIRKIPEKLNGYSDYEDIKFTLSNCVYDSLTTNEFEKDWVQMIETFSLQDNEWLNGLFKNRHLWVPAFVKDTFWAGMSSTQRSESVNSFFDGYVNARTTLKQFVEQYDNALRDKVEKENKADYKSFQEITPCITHYDFESQFQAAYSNEKFREFQEELRGKIYCYPSLEKKEGSLLTFKIRQDGKFRDQMAAAYYVVLYNEEDSNVQCICRHFEFRGILCSHILSVLALMEIREVPSRYLVQRWRKDLKCKHTFIKCSYDDVANTPVARHFDEMCKCFYEVAENGAGSDELFSLVMDGINELQIKIDAYHESEEAQEHLPIPEHVISMQEKIVLSPITLRKRGRPPTIRKESKVAKLVKKIKMKKQQKSASTSGGKLRKQTKARKNIVSHSSNRTEDNFDRHCYGADEAASTVGSFPNDYQLLYGLQTNQSDSQSHITSYADLLQGKEDVLGLLSQD